MAAKPKKGITELSELIGQDPPAEFKDLSAGDLTALNRILGESLDLHEASLAKAEDDVIKLAPRPLRGTVRKMLGAG